jgi:hypothetical protein
MADIAELERRIRRLEDIEAIRKVRSLYWNSLDKKLWDQVASCFAEDAYGEWFGYPYEGKAAILKQLKRVNRPEWGQVHQGHDHVIEITSDTTAKGSGELWDTSWFVPQNSSIFIVAFYEDEYVKQKDGWKIKRYILNMIYRKNASEGMKLEIPRHMKDK